MNQDPDRWRGRAAEPDPGQHASGHADGTPEDPARRRRRSRRLLRALLRPHRRSLALAVALLLGQNAAAMAGPYLVMLGIDHGIDALERRDDARTLTAVGIAFAIATTIEYAGKRGFLTVSARIGQAVLLDLRTRVYGHFQRLSVDFHEHYTAGRMVSRLTSDMDAIAELLDGGIEWLVLATLSVVSVAGVLLWLDAPLAAVTLLTFPFLAWLSRWFAAESTRAYRRGRETVSLVIVHFVESLGGLRAVQAFRRERRNQQIFGAVNDDYREAFVRVFRLVAAYSPGLKLAGNVALAVVLGYGGWLVIEDRLRLGVLTAFLLYLRRFFEPMQELSQFYNALQSATAALEKLSGVLDRRPGVPEPPAGAPRLRIRKRAGTPRPAGTAKITPEPNSTAKITPEPNSTANGTTEPNSTANGAPVPRDAERQVYGTVALRDVTFWYRAGVPVLSGLDVVIPAGQTVALVGKTGAGKSTIAKLLARFYDPVTGAVTLDGIDLRQIIDTDLRRAVVMVTQEVFLFSGTVADNIRFGRPCASDDEVAEAAAAIGADRFIRGLPQGYHTLVRSSGGRLSAGQRQLVAFARAFLADPAVLLLDEATSSLDVPSERLVQRALRTILADRTAVVIAHRLSTVQIADRVLVLDAGRLVEDGSPAQLITDGGRYADLHRQWRESLR